MTKITSETITHLKAKPEKWAAFVEWWDEDWSWDALPSKMQFEGKQSLQDYWRDQESTLIKFGGRRWTRVHLPPCDRDGNICSAWSKAKGDLFWSAIEQRLLDISLPIDRALFVDKIKPQPAVLHGVVFPEWPQAKVEKIISAYFEKCIFLGWCAFSNKKIANSFFDKARFLGDAADFSGTEFLDGGAHFAQSQMLCGIVGFSGAKFHSGAYFREAWLTWPNFSGAVFKDGCDFSDVVFLDSGLYFIGAEFGGGYAHFDRIVVNGVADYSFAKFESLVSFTDAVFNYDVYFRCDKGGVFASVADFNGAVFERTADFSGRSFNQTTDFRRTKFNGLPMFYDCELGRETLFDGDSFKRRKWLDPLDKITLEQKLGEEERERIRRRRIRFNDDHMFRRRDVDFKNLASSVPISVTWNDRARLFELAFRNLRQLSIGNAEDEMNFHALELSARRARTDVPLFERAIIYLYDWLSDYGRSMWRPIWIFLVVAAISVLVGTPLIRQALDKGKLLNHGIELPSWAEVAMYIVRNFIPPPPVWSENLGRAWAVGINDIPRILLFLAGMFQTIVFASFVALFLIALRRRFRVRD